MRLTESGPFRVLGHPRSAFSRSRVRRKSLIGGTADPFSACRTAIDPPPAPGMDRSPQRIDTLIELIEHEECLPESPERRKLARTLKELYDYLDTNRDLIPDYGDRRRHGESISSSIAESTVDQVISRRFVKKQQMRWQPETAHLLLQVRTQTLNGTLRETFQRWWPAMTPLSAPGLS
jgi:hypothetical protein